ncbi:hypothetical protein R69608_01422 [Paraburkholderia nemoris]|uniref:hypothetical protein n=1 Tax=Paraburkholderia nemoris TaxID=2793076 RepID=UPI001911F580|nr:hypothetical protein [Paraburkholderia nemoris]MBK5148044.1 hypothetical protein [Burkholderia sp. R-69608]CAE6876186.1 hypothetical protein R69608_01422 [Paraburkholderia nemoris]
MSNEAIQKHLSQDVAQLIAPAPAVLSFIKAPYDPAKERSGPRIRRTQSTASTRQLVPPRDHEPYVRLYAANVAALGLLGSVVFDYIADWYQPNAKTGKAKLMAQDCHGGYWVACSYDDLKDHTGLKKRDAERGIADCVEAGVLETTVMKFGKGADRKRMLHIRIAAAAGQPTLKGPLIVSPNAGEQTPKHAGVLKNDSQAPGCALLGDQSTGACFPITSPTCTSPTSITSVDSVAASPATNPSPEFSTEGTGKDKPKTPTPDAVEVAPKIDKSLLNNGKPPLTFAREWEQTRKEQGVYIPLTRKLCRKLSDARKKLYAAGVEAGFTPSQIMQFVLGDWIGFGLHVRYETKCGYAPMEPDVDYFVKYVGEAVSFRREKYISPEQIAAEKESKAKALEELEAVRAATAAAPAKPKKIRSWDMTPEQRAEWAKSLKPMYPDMTPAPATPLVEVVACAGIPEPSEPVTEPAPTPEPEPQPVDCPQVVQAVEETPSPAPAATLMDDEQPQLTPDEIRAWWAKEIARKAAADAEAARVKAQAKITAASNHHYKTPATA